MKKTLSICLLIILLLSFNNFTAYADNNIINPNQKYSYETMVKDIVRLQEKYPNLISYQVIGKSEYGRDIYAVSLGKGNASIFINGSHHAREWMTTILNMTMIEKYADGYAANSNFGEYNIQEILNHTTIWFVPMVNPDGVTLQQFGLSKFPVEDHNKIIAINNGATDFTRWKANAQGVDLNRQYDANWQNILYNPGKPQYSNFKGNSPQSSSEVQAIVNFTYEIDPEIAVSYHSSGEILYWNFKQTGEELKRDTILAKTISSYTGYSLVKINPNPSGGGYTDWFIEKFKKPAFTPEISPYVGEKAVPLSYFSSIWDENRLVGLYVADEAYKLYVNKHPEEIYFDNHSINDWSSIKNHEYLTPNSIFN